MDAIRLSYIEELNGVPVRVAPIWINHEEWEDFAAGLYDKRVEYENVNASKDILCGRQLKQHMERVPLAYPKSTIVNFTNTAFNPKAWLGQATCNLLIGATATEVGMAWGLLSGGQRRRANNIAQYVIDRWRAERESVSRGERIRGILPEG